MKTLKFVIQSLATGVHSNGEYATPGHNNTIGFTGVCHLGSSGFKFDTKEEAVSFFKSKILPIFSDSRGVMFAIRTLDTSKCGNWSDFQQLVDEPIEYIS